MRNSSEALQSAGHRPALLGMHDIQPGSHRPRHTGLAASMVAIALALASPSALAAHDIDVPDVPANLVVPDGNEVFLVGHAVGTQNYVCLPTAGGYAWTFFGPQATLFNGGDKQLITHFLSTDTNGTARPTWQDSKDSSAIWGAVIASATSATAPEFVVPGAIPWLLLEIVDSRPGPNGGAKLTEVTYIQRLATFGGTAPAAGCAAARDVGKKALVPYTTDYYFYREND